jgi:hypothetical protein
MDRYGVRVHYEGPWASLLDQSIPKYNANLDAYPFKIRFP